MAIDLTGGLSPDLEYLFTERPTDPDMRESINAWIWGDPSAECGFPRIAVEAVADTWDTPDVQVNIALADGRVFNMFGQFPAHDRAGLDGEARILGAGPLSIEMAEPFGLLRMRLDGEATVNTVTDQINGALIGTRGTASVELEVEIRPIAPPWVNGALRPEAKYVLDTQEEGDIMGHPWRFEQLCRANGTLRVEGRVYQFEGGANRVRRQSVRRAAKLRGHVWQAGLFPSGRGFGLIVYPDRTDGKATYNEGYIFDGDGELIAAKVVDAPWLRTLRTHRDQVPVTLETARGSVRIEGEVVHSTFMLMPPEIGGGLQLNQAIARYTWDGETGMGMLERSTPAGAVTPVQVRA